MDGSLGLKGNFCPGCGLQHLSCRLWIEELQPLRFPTAGLGAAAEGPIWVRSLQTVPLRVWCCSKAVFFCFVCFGYSLKSKNLFQV